MFLEVNIVKFRDIVLQFFLFEDLLDEVLAVVPAPWFVDLPEVLNNEVPLVDSLLIDADRPFSFSVDAEASLVLC